MNEVEIIKSIIFYGFAGLILISVLLSVIVKPIFYSLLFAIVAFFCAGGLFFSLNADYNAVVQIAVYGVAVPVIFLFAIMFTSYHSDKTLNFSFSPRFFISIISAVIFLMFMFYSVSFAIHFNQDLLEFFNPNKPSFGSYDSIFAIANGIYVNHSVALILFAVIMLTIIVGISVLNVIKEKKRG